MLKQLDLDEKKEKNKIVPFVVNQEGEGKNTKEKERHNFQKKRSFSGKNGKRKSRKSKQANRD